MDALPLEPYGKDVISWYATGWNDAINAIKRAPTVDAIPIDNVAEMLAGVYGDCCPCNYLDIDEWISVDCKRKNCPGFFETDYSCWKKYVEYWMKRKLDGGKQDAQETTL